MAAKAADTPELKDFIVPLKESGGFKTLGLVAFLVQAVNLVLGFVVQRLAGIYRLLILNGMTLVFGVVLLRLQGLGWAECFLHAQTTAMAQVFFHQVINQFLKKPQDDFKLLTKRGQM